MTFGAAPPQPPREPPHPQRLRNLWRVERREAFHCQVITAAIYCHPMPSTCELRVFIEPEDRNDLLHSEIARFDLTPLEEKAGSLREVLLEKGWTLIP